MGESVSSQYRIVENAKLDARNTFGVAARAPMLVEVAHTDALPELFGYAMLRDGPVLVLGGGSNLLFAGDPQGVVLALTAQSIALIEDDGDTAIVRADAGVEWHAFVLWTLGHGLAGLENLALIPGTVGAAPIQNIGAYGVEVRESIHAVHAFDRTTRTMTTLSAAQLRLRVSRQRVQARPGSLRRHVRRIPPLARHARADRLRGRRRRARRDGHRNAARLAGRRSRVPHPPPQAAGSGGDRQRGQLLQESDRAARAGAGAGRRASARSRCSAARTTTRASSRPPG